MMNIKRILSNEFFDIELKHFLAKKKVVEINKHMVEETNCKKPEDKTKELLKEIKESYTKINKLREEYLSE